MCSTFLWQLLFFLIREAFKAWCNISLSRLVKMSLQISVMLIPLAPCFWPGVEYIVLKEQMDSEFHWEMEIGWQPANSSVLQAEWVAALNLPSAVWNGGGRREGGRGIILNKNMLQSVHQQMFTSHSRSNWIFPGKRKRRRRRRQLNYCGEMCKINWCFTSTWNNTCIKIRVRYSDSTLTEFIWKLGQERKKKSEWNNCPCK